MFRVYLMIGPEIIKWIVREQTPPQCSKEFAQKIKAARTLLVLSMAGKFEFRWPIPSAVLWDGLPGRRTHVHSGISFANRESMLTDFTWDDNDDNEGTEECNKDRNKKN